MVPRSRDDHRFVAHRRDVGAARRAHAHDGRELRNAPGAHHRLVAKDPPEVIPVGEDLGLERQERPAAVHQIHTREFAAGRDFLGAEVFFDRQREVGPTLHGGIVRDHHCEPSRNRSHSRHQTGGRGGGVVALVAGERPDLEERGTRIGEPFDPLAHKELPLFRMARPCPAPATLAGFGQPGLQGLRELAVVCLVGPKFVGFRRDVGFEPGQTELPETA